MNIVDRIISPNIWDEEWETNNFFNGVSGSKNLIRIIPNVSYYIRTPSTYVIGNVQVYIRFFDVSGNYITGSQIQKWSPIIQASDIPANAYYMKFGVVNGTYGTTYNHNICINLSNPSINGKYFPYVMYKRYDIVDKPIYELPEGYIPTDIEVGGSYGVVDLGSLSWQGSSGAYYIGGGSLWGQTNFNLLHAIYYPHDGGTIGDNSMQVANGNLVIRSYTKPTGCLIYKRVTPSSQTLVRGNELNKYCIYNGQIGVYGDTFRYNSNIPLQQWLRRLKIGG